MSRDLKFLIKYPTRSRPNLFSQRLEELYLSRSGDCSIRLVVSIDEDDETMDKKFVTEQFNEWFYPDKDSLVVSVIPKGKSGKIVACNDAVTESTKDFKDTDILMLMSDDMVVDIDNWDRRIANEFKIHGGKDPFALHINDGLQGRNLITLSIMNLKLYREFDYIYHPDYTSCFCDDEFTQIVWHNRICAYIRDSWFKHQWVGINSPDELHEKNHKLMSADQPIFEARKRAGFPKRSIRTPQSPGGLYVG